MRRSHPFRFVRRQSGSRRIYYVIYDVDPSRPRSTGIAVDPRDARNAGPGYDEAVSWAYANQDQMLRPTLTFRRATELMFTEECAWRRRVTAKGRQFSSSYFALHRNRLVNYIWPRFGSFIPEQIRPAAIDEWLLNLTSVTTGKPLAPAMKDKILQTLRKAMDELEYQGILAQGQNPSRLVSYFTDTSLKRMPITLEEFHKLFPEDQDELVRIWGDLSWATFFYVMASCGLRPGEVAAIDLSYWIKGVGYPVSQSIEPGTRRVKGLKTSTKGIAVKPAYFNDRAESLLTQLIYQGAPQEGLFFRADDGRPYPAETSNKHFKASCKRAGIDVAGRTQYSLRHFYSTVIAKELSEEEAARYLGQRTYRDDYDHRDVVEKLKADRRMRQLSNELF